MGRESSGRCLMVPRHLDPLKVALVILIVGASFILMHGLGHKWSTQTCNICRLMQ